MSLVDVATPNPALFILPAKGEWGAFAQLKPPAGR
jgi:hypothetical protein